MRFIILTILLFLFLGTNFLSLIFNTSVSATEFKPSDFKNELSDFSISIGENREDGRYIKFKYEYK